MIEKEYIWILQIRRHWKRRGLLLRRFTENDLCALFAIHSDKEVNTYLPWFPLQSIEEASLFLKERYLDTYSQPYGYRYAICLKTDNLPIGYVNIDANEPHDLGYGLLKAFWRNGIVTEAANASSIKPRKMAFLTLRPHMTSRIPAAEML